MTKIFAAIIYLPIFVSVFCLPAAKADVIRETIQSQVNKVLEILNDPALKDESSNEITKEKIRPLVNNIFDYTECAKRTLNRNWKKLDATQREEFVKLFRRLLEKVYMERLLKTKIKEIDFFDGSMVADNRAELRTKVITKYGTEIPIRYRMILKESGWKAYDVVVEGISLVKYYRNKFKRVLANQPPEKLFEFIRKKVHSQDTKS